MEIGLIAPFVSSLATPEYVSNYRQVAEAFWAAAARFERRGARCRAFTDVIKSLWMEPVSSCENDFYSPEPCRLYPKPVQTPHHLSNARPRSSLRTRSLAIPIPSA